MDFSSGLTRPNTRRSWQGPHGGNGLGFTLIELIVAVVIVGIFAAIALPNFASMIHRSNVRAAADELYNLLQYSRAEAVTRGTLVTLAAPASSSANWVGDLQVSTGSTTLRKVGAAGLQSGIAITTAVGSVPFSATGTTTASACFQISYATDASIAAQFIGVQSSGRITPPSLVKPAECS